MENTAGTHFFLFFYENGEDTTMHLSIAVYARRGRKREGGRKEKEKKKANSEIDHITVLISFPSHCRTTVTFFFSIFFFFFLPSEQSDLFFLKVFLFVFVFPSWPFNVSLSFLSASLHFSYRILNMIHVMLIVKPVKIDKRQQRHQLRIVRSYRCRQL